MPIALVHKPNKKYYKNGKCREIKTLKCSQTTAPTVHISNMSVKQ